MGAEEVTPVASAEVSEEGLRFLATLSHMTGEEPLKL